MNTVDMRDRDQIALQEVVALQEADVRLLVTYHQAIDLYAELGQMIRFENEPAIRLTPTELDEHIDEWEEIERMQEDASCP